VLPLTGGYCGDGTQNGPEACDDGNTTSETSCPYGTASCTRCNASCSAPLNLSGAYCGDGVRNGSEACDDGNTETEVACAYGEANCNRCDASCSTVLNLTGPFCGDGVRNGPETCDDGNTTTETACPYGTQNCTRCDATCSNTLPLTGPYCGDGIRNGPEACDDHNTLACGTCSATCSQSQLAPATGRILILSSADLRDGTDLIILEDGINPAVVFEFDRNGTVAPGNIPVPYTAISTRSEAAASLAAAINSLGASLEITAVASSSAVDLVHDRSGVFGNRSISTTARSNTIAVSGMFGGGGADCPAGTGCTQNADCTPDLVCRTDSTCGVP
jgi:cysteine-rich repeat protein